MDWINKRFVKLMCLESPTKYNKYKVRCLCDCGKEKRVYYCDLKTGRTKSCGCIRQKMASVRAKKMGDENGGKNRLDIIGYKYNRLIAVKPTKERRGKSIIWEWLCDCGNVVYERIASIKKGNTKSCGCLNKEIRLLNIKKAYMNNKLEKHPNWLGGKSFEPYGIKFNRRFKERIRVRDNHTCQKCSIKQGFGKNELPYKLSIHHIDYDKQNNSLDNLISLCTTCHIKTNFNREYWTGFFNEVVFCG